MNALTHTDGPVQWDSTPWDYDPAEDAPWLVNAAGEPVLHGGIQCREADARLLATAYNAFDSAARRLDVNAVELAERMSTCGIADLAECLRDMLSRFRSCIAQGNGEIEGDREAIAKAEAALATVMGGAA